MADPTPEQKRDRKLLALVDELEATIALAHDQLVTIKRTLAGENPIARAMEYYALAWKDVYSPTSDAVYVWNRKVDPAQIKRLLVTLTLDELKTRMGNYLRNRDPFYLKNRHAFGVFVSTINAHGTNAKTPSRKEAPESAGAEDRWREECLRKHAGKCKDFRSCQLKMVEDFRRTKNQGIAFS